MMENKPDKGGFWKRQFLAMVMPPICQRFQVVSYPLTVQNFKPTALVLLQMMNSNSIFL